MVGKYPHGTLYRHEYKFCSLLRAQPGKRHRLPVTHSELITNYAFCYDKH